MQWCNRLTNFSSLCNDVSEIGEVRTVPSIFEVKQLKTKVSLKGNCNICLVPQICQSRCPCKCCLLRPEHPGLRTPRFYPSFLPTLLNHCSLCETFARLPSLSSRRTIHTSLNRPRDIQASFEGIPLALKSEMPNKVSKTAIHKIDKKLF